MSDKDTLFVFCADTHCGSTLGLMKPEPFNLFDGGTYNPSPAQNVIWRTWADAWEKVKDARKGKRLIVVHVGDAVEGFHHETTETVSTRTEDHEEIHIECMDWALNKSNFDDGKGDALYYISGTEEHVGRGSSSEERVAKQFDGIVPMNDSRFTWNVIRKEINGVLFDISHHGASAGGGNAVNEGNSLRNRIKNIYTDCLDAGYAIPRYWIRAHVHQYITETHTGGQGTITGIILPSFQLKTGYVYKRMNNRYKANDIGVVSVAVYKNGLSEADAHILKYDQDRVGEW